MPYIRVKSADTGHEFDVNPARVAAHPEWSVVDPEPVAKQRPPKHGKPKRRSATAESADAYVTAVESAEAKTEPEEAPKPANDDRLSKRSAPTGN